MKRLLRQLTVIPMDGPDCGQGQSQACGDVTVADIRIRDGFITAIGDLSPEPGESVFEGEGLTAIPGFVQGHIHFCQTLFRGLADDLPLLPWLCDRIWPFEAAHDSASTRASAELACAELLRGGTTTVQVMESVRHAEQSFAVAAEAGLETILGNCLMDVQTQELPAGMCTTKKEALAISEELRSNFDGKGRLHYAVSPRFLLSVSDELSRDVAGFAKDHKLRIHTHAAEHPAEVEAVRGIYGTDYLVTLHEQGLLGRHTSLAHCVHLSDRERELLVETDTAVMHCPSTNLKLGSGIAEIHALRQRGVRVAIGADGAACNNRLSALTELRQAALLQAVQAGPGAWTAEQALYTQTLGGAKALGLDHILGSLQVGKRADITIFDLKPLQPGGSEISRIVYSADESNITQVIVGGDFAVEDGILTRFDAAAVQQAAVTQRELLLNRIATPR